MLPSLSVSGLDLPFIQYIKMWSENLASCNLANTRCCVCSIIGFRDGALDEQEFERLLEACDQGDPKERLIVHQGLES